MTLCHLDSRFPIVHRIDFVSRMGQYGDQGSRHILFIFSQ